jgi:RimJ/RimL family protein N-acetyltransferase
MKTAAVLRTRSVLAAIGRRLWSRRELRIYACSAERIRALPHPRLFSRDRWDDLRHCTMWSYDHLSRQQYLAVLEERRQVAGNHLYSLVENGVLVNYGWLTARQERAPDAAIGLEVIPPPCSASVWDCFTHPSARGRGLYRQSLWQSMHDAVELDGANQVFVYVYADNAMSRRVIEKAGFEYHGSLVLERRLFRTKRCSMSSTHDIDVRLLRDHSPARSARRESAVPATSPCRAKR